MFFKKKAYEDEDDVKTSRLKLWHKVAIGIFALCFVFLFIPQSAIENLVNKANNDEQEIPEEQQVLEVLEEDSEGNFKFDTVFGGTDYKEEYDAFWAENTLEGHELLEEHLSTTDLGAIFDSITPVGVQEDDIVEEIIPENPFSLSMLETADRIRFSTMADRVCIGVVQDVYVVSWIKGTDFIFVDDYSDKYFDDYYFTRQMLHFGKSVTNSFSVGNVKVEEFDKFTILYVGGN